MIIDINNVLEELYKKIDEESAKRGNKNLDNLLISNNLFHLLNAKYRKELYSYAVSKGIKKVIYYDEHNVRYELTSEGELINDGR